MLRNWLRRWLGIEQLETQKAADCLARRIGRLEEQAKLLFRITGDKVRTEIGTVFVNDTGRTDRWRSSSKSLTERIESLEKELAAEKVLS